MVRVAARLAAISIGAVVGLALAFQPSDAQTPPAGTVAFTGARIIDGTGKAPIEGGTIVVTNGRIIAVGPSASVTVPAGATRINAAGKTIIPGLINAHGHVSTDDYTKLPRREHMMNILKAYAEYGVTTTTNLGSYEIVDETESLKIRDEQRKNGHDRARLYDAGENAIGKTPEEARQSVARLADVKVDLIKYHINGNAKDMNPETYGALVDEAKKRGFMTTVHIFNLRDAKGAVEKGTNAIVHSVRDQNVDQELIDMMKRNNVGYVPTLTRDLSVFVYENEPAFWREPFFQKGMYVYKTQVDILKDPAEQQKARTSPQVQRIKVALEQAKRNLKLLSDAGVLIGMGTDTASPNDLGRWPGYFEHTEMELMVASGMTPMQVITAATGNAARILRLDNIGTIATGKEADLVVLNANPLDNIRNTRQIDSVWIAGRRWTGTGR
jgi:imidazolonepropionase-like amidohydrolase